MSNDVDPRGEGLREVEQAAERVAREAEGALDEHQRAAVRGQETDYDFRLPPDVAEADRVRAEGDVELISRQEDMAETQRRAAEALRRNADTLAATGEALDRTARDVHQNRRDVGEIQENADALRAQTAQTRDRVDRAEVPRVDEGDGERGRDDRGGQ